MQHKPPGSSSGAGHLNMKLIPGGHDDGGSIGKYLLFVRRNGFSLICAYFAEDDPLAPTVCR
jgi:hypothetical protein